ncbi:MAG: hypothetical protein ACE5KM_05090 [Planctomycetaceae bacterium]
MRGTRRAVAVVALMLMCAGCSSLSGNRPANAIQSVSGHRPAADRAVELEPEPADERGGSTWKRFLNPFAAKKKRIPLPLSPKSAETGADESSAGF